MKSPRSIPASHASRTQRPRAWADCDLFCISGYAGAACGWRGRLFEADWDPDRRSRLCPRCGRATLMPVPHDAESCDATPDSHT